MGFRTPPLGTNFAIFYATGVVPFMTYLDMSGKVANSIRYSKPLLAGSRAGGMSFAPGCATTRMRHPPSEYAARSATDQQALLLG